MTRTSWLILLFGCALLSACGKPENPAPVASRSDDTADSSDTQANEGDPCSLLEPAEVEAVIGKLALPPYREGMNGPEAAGGKCVYATKDFHRLILDVTWTDGAMIMKMLGMPAAAADQAGLRGKLPLPDGLTLSGEWDEAKALSCCEITALRGDSVVAIDFMGTELTTSQGADLLNAALRRLEAPLKSADGAASVDAASKRDETGAGRATPVPACTLLTAADAAALLGPVDTLPEDNDRKCEYRSKSKPQLVSLTVRWTQGYREWRSDRDLAVKTIGALFGDQAKDPASVPPATQYSGPWEKAEVVVTDFVAVRGDVIMRIDIRGTSLDNARALMAIAMNRVNWPASP